MSPVIYRFGLRYVNYSVIVYNYAVAYNYAVIFYNYAVVATTTL